MNRAISVRVCVQTTCNPIYDYTVPCLADVPNIGDTMGLYVYPNANIERGKVMARNLYYATNDEGNLYIVKIHLTVKFPVEKWYSRWDEWCSDNQGKPFDKMIKYSNKQLRNMASSEDISFLLRHGDAFGLDDCRKFLLEQFLKSKNQNDL